MREHKDSRRRVPGVASAQRRIKSGTGRRPFMGNGDTPTLGGSKARTQATYGRVTTQGKEGVGEFRKTRHPRNVEFNKVLETCFSGAGNSRFSEAWNL
jgi:hypothetical protein